nr:hypothetical protein [uncultured Rhodopila sp.]
MTRLSLATAFGLAAIMAVPAAFAQQPSNNSTPQKESSNGATKQKTQGDPSGQYNFATPGGQYSSRPAVKQRTEGQQAAGTKE